MSPKSSHELDLPFFWHNLLHRTLQKKQIHFYSLSLTRRRIFSPCLLLSTALIIQLPLLKVPTIHLLPLSILGIFVHPKVSALPSISLHHISGGWWWRLQHPCPPDILRLKTLQHADHYKLPSVCSAPWPLWPNLEAKQISIWPHLQNATVRVSRCKPQSPCLLPLKPPIPAWHW